MKVVIDGIEYVPAVEVKPPSDSAVNTAIQELVAMIYFQDHKPYAHAWDALNALAPNMAELVTLDPRVAYDAVNPETD